MAQEKIIEDLKAGTIEDSPRKLLSVMNLFGVTIEPVLLWHHMRTNLFSRKVLFNQLVSYRKENRNKLMALILDSLQDTSIESRKKNDWFFREIVDGISFWKLISGDKSTGTIRYSKRLPDWFLNNWREKFISVLIERISKDPENEEFPYFWNDLFQSIDVPYLFETFCSLPESKGKSKLLQQIWWNDSTEHLEGEVIPYLLKNWSGEYLKYIGNFDSDVDENIFSVQFTKDIIFNKLYSQIWEKNPEYRPSLIGEFFSFTHFLSAYKEYQTDDERKRRKNDTLISGLNSLHSALPRHIHFRTEASLVDIYKRKDGQVISINKGSNEKKLFDILFEIATNVMDPNLSAWAFLCLKFFGMKHASKAFPLFSNNLLEAKSKLSFNFKNNPIFHRKSNLNNIPKFLFDLLEWGDMSALESILTLIDNGILFDTENFYPDHKEGYYLLFYTLSKGCPDPAMVMNALKDRPNLQNAFLKYIRQEGIDHNRKKKHRLLPKNIGLPQIEYKITPGKSEFQ